MTEENKNPQPNAEAGANGFGKERDYNKVRDFAALEPSEDYRPEVNNAILNAKDVFEEMERRLAPFAEDPYNAMDLVHELDADVQREIEKKADAFSNAMQRNAGRFTELRRPLEAASAMSQELKELSAESKRLAGSLLKAPVKVVKGGIKGINFLVKKLTGEKEKELSPEEEVTQFLSKRLPELHRQVNEASVSIDKALNEFSMLRDEMVVLQTDLVNAIDMMGIMIGIGRELQRRYVEEYIPEAAELLEAAPDDPTLKQSFDNLGKINARLIKKVAMMQQQYTTQIMQLTMVDNQVNDIVSLGDELKAIKNSAPSNWKMALSVAQSAVQMASAGDVVRALQMLSDQTLETAVDAHMHAREQTASVAENLLESAKKLENHAGRLIEAGRKHDDREARLLEGVRDQANRQSETAARLLQASEDSKAQKAQARLEAAKPSAAFNKKPANTNGGQKALPQRPGANPLLGKK